MDAGLVYDSTDKGFHIRQHHNRYAITFFLNNGEKCMKLTIEIELTIGHSFSCRFNRNASKAPSKNSWDDPHE